MTIAKAITKTLDISVEDVRIDLTATIRSYDLTDTQFIFEIKSSNGMTVNLTGSTAIYIVEYVHNSQTYAIQGDIDIIGTDTLSFNLPEDLKGYSGTVLIGIYVKLTDGTKIDIKDIAVRIEPSIMDKDIDFSAKTYFKDFESVKAEVISEGEKAKTSINAVVTDVNGYADTRKQAIHDIVTDVQSTGDTAKAEINATLPTLQTKISELKEDINKLNEGGLNLKDEVIAEDINNWLDEHPEVTTTVQDGSVTLNKLHDSIKYRLGVNTIIPQMFGICGDGRDCTSVFTAMFNYANEHISSIYIPKGVYKITGNIPKLYRGVTIRGEKTGTERNGVLITDARNGTDSYLISTDKTIYSQNGGCIENIAFSTEGELNNFGIDIDSAWDFIISECSFWGYETALKLKGDDARIVNCQFIFCGSKVKKTKCNYGVLLSTANEKRFNACHFEHSRFFVEITDSSWSNSFVNCKFETGTQNSAINTDAPTIKIESATSNYPTTFVNCDFHALDIEFYIERAGMDSYDNVPYMMTGNDDSLINLESCTFMSGPGSGETIYKQYSQSKYIYAINASIDNCVFLKPSYIVSAINVKNLNMCNCSINIDKNGTYTRGVYSEDVPIITTEFGHALNTRVTFIRSTMDKYFRIFNKNLDFTTPRNNAFCRGNEIYNSEIYIVINAHQTNFALPYELIVSNTTSGNFYGTVVGRLVSWNGTADGTINLKGSGKATAYFFDKKVVIKLEGFNSSAGAHACLNILKTLPYDWYICTSYDVSNAVRTTVIKE